MRRPQTMHGAKTMHSSIFFPPRGGKLFAALSAIIPPPSPARKGRLAAPEKIPLDKTDGAVYLIFND